MYSQYQYTKIINYYVFFLFREDILLCVKARPSDPLENAWILWCQSLCSFYNAVHLFYSMSSVQSKVSRFCYCMSKIINSLLHVLAYEYWRISPPSFAARGVRKVTTGITGLWRRSVQSDAAFWFFDVGSSYPVLASGYKGKFVHLPTGNVSWV